MHLEDATNRGRIDVAVLFNGHVYLFEFKVVPEGRALHQIIERAYAEEYRARGEPIHLIGVKCSREMRSVVGFEVQLDRGRAESRRRAGRVSVELKCKAHPE